MNIYISKTQSKKLILDHIEEELTTGEFYNLLVTLIELYRKFEGADVEDLRPLLKVK